MHEILKLLNDLGLPTLVREDAKFAPATPLEVS